MAKQYQGKQVEKTDRVDHMPFRHEKPLLGRRCRDNVDRWEASSNISVVEHLHACGFAKVKGLLKPEDLRPVHQAFLKLEASTRAKHYVHAQLRERRAQYALPCETPFCDPAIFANEYMVDIVKAYLGRDFVLDVVTVVVAPAFAAAQDNHRDSQSPGGVTVQVALHPMNHKFAPLTLCGGTHNITADDKKEIFQVAQALAEKHWRILTPKDAYHRALCKDQIVAAPMEIGDVVIYDNMVSHWGSVNTMGIPRYALYIHYKNSTEHPGAYPDFDEVSKEGRVALQGFSDAFHSRRVTEKEQLAITSSENCRA